MPREKNKTLRILVPLIAILAGIGLGWAVLVSSTRSTTTAPSQQQQAVEEQSPAPTPAPTPAPGPVAATNGAGHPTGEESSPRAQSERELAQATSDEATAPTDTSPAPAVIPAEPNAFAGIYALPAPAPTFPAPIGAIDPDSELFMEVRFSPFGAGIEAITLANHYETVVHKVHYKLQERAEYETPSGAKVSVSSLAARAIVVNGVFVDLYSSFIQGRAIPIWREIRPGAFEATIVNADGDKVLQLRKRYTLTPNSYELAIEQIVENVSGTPLSIQWVQYGPVDLPNRDSGYGGDKRRLRFGFLHNSRIDPSRQIVNADQTLRARSKVVSQIDKAGAPVVVWPYAASIKNSFELVWVAMTNRYFAFAVYPDIAHADPSNAAPAKNFSAVEKIYASLLGARSAAGSDDRALILQLNSPALDIAPGASLDLSLRAYAGPEQPDVIAAEKGALAVGLDKIVVYNFGGPCAFCTFPFLTNILLGFLGLVHDYVTRDWALAILILVVCVRTILHPVTKRSQIGIQRFSKQMQAVQPKVKKIQERYANDPQKLKTETMRLYKEENIRFTGMLGCLPMFLQSPIWIALYASLFFSFSLRQEPAFYGVFQALIPNWAFLADLSAPDSFIKFASGPNVPLMGELNAINILPLFLGVVFYLQQKYLTPPPSASATPEQQQQQKIMKVMFVFMFPLIMYNAPSGLTIYFITNSSLGILESRYIRAHIDKLDLEGPPKKKPSPDQAGRKRVDNTAKNPFGKLRERQGTGYKQRKKG